MTIFAAGCVVYRRSDVGVEVLLIHRDRYDDWTLPKGKRDKGEGDLECALREVEEETGFTGALGPELGEVRYQVKPKKAKSKDALEDKVVRWWLLEKQQGEFQPNEEVDAIEWVSLAEAQQRLSYEMDQELLEHPTVLAL